MNYSPEEHITRFKNATTPNASGTVDELFRRNYGIPAYKYEEENGKIYVLVKASSTAVCETITFYFRIDGNKYVPERSILYDQVKFKENYLGKDATDLILDTIFQND